MRTHLLNWSLLLSVVLVLSLTAVSGAQNTAYQENQWMEGAVSHIGKLTGHAKNAREDYRR